LVLVVDDELAIREATREILEQNQYRVITACDGREAMDIYLRERDTVRLVITDMMMPVMSGAALVRALRAIEPKLKIIACSGLDQEAKRAEMAALGVAEIIMKPFTAAQLLAMLRRHLASEHSMVPWDRS
jgi:two-component system cell cycle sensor histidine kinase/response regulator CckA